MTRAAIDGNFCTRTVVALCALVTDSTFGMTKRKVTRDYEQTTKARSTDDTIGCEAQESRPGASDRCGAGRTAGASGEKARRVVCLAASSHFHKRNDSDNVESKKPRCW